MSNITVGNDFDQVPEKELPKHLSLWANDVNDTVNGKLDFVNNFGAKIVSASFTVGSTDLVVNHGLGRVPTGYIKVGSNVATTVYTGSAGATTTNLTLRSTAVATVSILVF